MSNTYVFGINSGLSKFLVTAENLPQAYRELLRACKDANSDTRITMRKLKKLVSFEATITPEGVYPCGVGKNTKPPSVFGHVLLLYL